MLKFYLSSFIIKHFKFLHGIFQRDVFEKHNNIQEMILQNVHLTLCIFHLYCYIFSVSTFSFFSEKCSAMYIYIYMHVRRHDLKNDAKLSICITFPCNLNTNIITHLMTYRF